MLLLFARRNPVFADGVFGCQCGCPPDALFRFGTRIKTRRFFTADKKPLTKTQIITEIAETAELSKKDVATVVDALSELIKKSLGKKGAGTFTLPGILKVYKQHVKAKPAQKNVPNPLKPGTFSDRPAKPAHDRVKVKALKALKEVV